MSPSESVGEQTIGTMDLDVIEAPAVTRQLDFSGSLLTRYGWAVYKRTQDVILTLMIIVILTLPMVCIALWIKGGSSGPILFRQRRRGINTSDFTCFKFRTMYHNQCDMDASVQSSRNDPRITPVGVWLRKTSLDELPQLLNVLTGHMSLIGPRPHALGTAINGRLLPALADDYMLRYAIRPGITGWAQVNGWRGILDTEEKLQKRIEYDLYYIVNWSPLLDLRILVKTLFCVLDRDAF
jgi:lipopolysaccharide/colanic/teichoic acid biosynthesis glycosyltransferase